MTTLIENRADVTVNGSQWKKKKKKLPDVRKRLTDGFFKVSLLFLSDLCRLRGFQQTPPLFFLSPSESCSRREEEKKTQMRQYKRSK